MATFPEIPYITPPNVIAAYEEYIRRLNQCDWGGGGGTLPVGTFGQHLQWFGGVPQFRSEFYNDPTSQIVGVNSNTSNAQVGSMLKHVDATNNVDIVSYVFSDGVSASAGMGVAGFGQTAEQNMVVGTTGNSSKHSVNYDNAQGANTSTFHTATSNLSEWLVTATRIAGTHFGTLNMISDDANQSTLYTGLVSNTGGTVFLQFKNEATSLGGEGIYEIKGTSSGGFSKDAQVFYRLSVDAGNEFSQAGIVSRENTPNGELLFECTGMTESLNLKASGLFGTVSSLPSQSKAVLTSRIDENTFESFLEAEIAGDDNRGLIKDVQSCTSGVTRSRLENTWKGVGLCGYNFESAGSTGNDQLLGQNFAVRGAVPQPMPTLFSGDPNLAQNLCIALRDMGIIQFI